MAVCSDRLTGCAILLELLDVFDGQNARQRVGFRRGAGGDSVGIRVDFRFRSRWILARLPPSCFPSALSFWARDVKNGACAARADVCCCVRLRRIVAVD